MRSPREGDPGSRWLGQRWLVALGIAVLAGALWLRAPDVRYLVLEVGATVLAIAWGLGARPRARAWVLSSGGALVLFAVLSGVAQAHLSRIEHDWAAEQRRLERRGAAVLEQELEAASAELAAAARRALDAPRAPRRAFQALRGAASAAEDRAVVLLDQDRPVAWAGRSYAPLDSLRDSSGVVSTPFYTTLYASATRGERRAVATAVVHAAPPADRLAATLDERAATRSGVRGFAIVPDESAGEGAVVTFARGGDTLLRAIPVAPSQGEARLELLATAQARGAGLLLLAVLALFSATWRATRRLGVRLLPVLVALAAVYVMPLSSFSSDTPLFDPTVYFAEVGRAYTASVGALAIASGLVLLGLLLILRTRVRAAPRWMAAVVMVAVVASGPFLLRSLGSGVSTPPGGVSAELWLGWEVALFLAAASLLVAMSAASVLVLGRTRGLPPVVAPAFAAIAAVVGPLALEPSGRWPGWYAAIWILVLASLALSRRHRALVLTSGAVAALGATSLTWHAGVRGRMALADRDVAALGTPEASVRDALERFGETLRDAPAPESEGDLLRHFVRSDLVGTGFPVELISWSAAGPPKAELALADFEPPSQAVSGLVAEALHRESPVLEAITGTPGVFQVLAVPYAGGAATTVVVAPRTRLIPEDPFNPLLGLEARETNPVPYTLSLAEPDPQRVTPAGGTRWYHQGSELHGDRLVMTSRGPARAHIEMELRTLDVLVERGALVVLLDLLILLALWAFTVVPDESFGRWLRTRARWWTASYRARLTVALFAFFVVPAVAFALWSYRRLQQEDRQARELLVRELLRSVSSGGVERLGNSGGRLDTPLLMYSEGVLRAASDPVFTELTPTGRMLPGSVHLALEEGGEVNASAVERIGDAQALFGFRDVLDPTGDRLVVAAPARGSEYALSQRRSDLGVLVLFSTVLGAMAALALSGIAARSLAQPIGRLRRAALAIAGGEREPPLAGEPPVEFVPVFSAFRRMAADLGESRAALETAQRRTAAVLRNVASGVVAVTRAGDVTLANPQAEQLVRQRLSPGMPLEAALPSELAGRVRQFLAHEDDEEEFDLSLEGRQHHARLTRLTGGGGGAVITLDDVSEMARAQRVIAWGEMARQVAHEIKNPLTPIRLGIQHVKRAHADARPDFDAILDQNVARILAEIDRLDEIARGFSRYGTAPAERLPAEPTDVAHVARDVVELERMGRDGVVWSMAGVEAPLVAMAREEELREVLLNVLENARHAAATRVEVRATREPEHVRLEVQDDGEGIPAAVLPRIFEPHFSTRTSGSGLGLAISRRMVEGWGGEIAIASVPGEGTTVLLRLRAIA